MAIPSIICRGKNLHLATIKQFLAALPKKSMPKADFFEYAEKRMTGFKQTHSQIARQMALYYCDAKDICHPRFSDDLAMDQLLSYARYWAEHYFVPNPYTPSFPLSCCPTNIYGYIVANNTKYDGDLNKILSSIFNQKLNEVDKARSYLLQFTGILEGADGRLICDNLSPVAISVNINPKDEFAYFHYYDAWEQDGSVKSIEEARKKEFYEWLISKKLTPDYADDLVNAYLVCLSDELKMPPVKTAWHGLREYLYGEKPGKSIYAVTDSHELIKYYGEIDRLFAKIAEPGPLDVKRFNECRAWADSKDNNRAVRAAWIQYKDFMKWRDAQQSTEELPKNVDLLSVALKLFAEKRAVDTTEVWDNYNQWTHSVRGEFSQVDETLLGDPNFDYAAYMRKYAISVQTANVYFATHTTEEKSAVLKFLSQQRDAPMATSYYIDAKNRLQVDGKNVNGMGPTVILYFMSELWPEEFAVWSTPTWDSLSFLGLYNGPTPKDVTIDTYEVCRSKQQQIIARMKELGIGKASDDASDADYRTVNEFLWWLGQDDNKDLIKKEAMAAMYQKTEIKKVQQTKITDFSDFIKKLENDVTSAGFKYAPGLMKRFVCAQLAKPFVVLTGLSGSGKTKLAQAFSEWIAVENTSLVVPVGADWTNSERLLGFPNALDPDNYVLPDTRVLEFILDARDNQDLPFFLILDEMNLSHVERYFADFLSAMESGDEIKLYAGKDRYASNGRLIPQTLEIPKNLFVIGTMNVDETTYMFSPKVLDRAQVIEFRVSKQEMSDFLAKPGNPKLSDLADKGVEFAKAFLDLAGERKTKQPAAPELTDVKTALDAFFPSLAELGAEFGYRTAIEIVTFVAYYLDASGYAKMPVGTNKKTCLTQAIDAAILQKLLPKLHGAINRLGPVLDALVEKSIKKIPQANDPDAEPTIQEIYPLTYEKLKRMKVRLEKNNFTSFAEA